MNDESADPPAPGAAGDVDFEGTLTSTDQLREHYREPGSGAIDKVTTRLDHGCRDFLAQSTFVVIGTSDAGGNQDVSPRGGPPGFVKVVDERRLVVPDLSGNNRLDSLQNIVENPSIGMLFFIPGLDETLRLNGRAVVTIDDRVRGLFADELRTPKSAIGVTIDQAYIHCAKSLRRGSLWDPDCWPDASCRPSPAQIMIDHAEAGHLVTAAEVEANLEASYEHDLAADRPDGPAVP